MVHSIRWRLVASYVLLALLTVSVVGVLSVEIVQRYAHQQELNELEANAQAVAHQASALMWPAVHRHELSQLVQTASFLGNLQVRILDLDGQVLADSGQPAEASNLVWITPPAGQDIFPEVVTKWTGLVMLTGERLFPLEEVEISLLKELPPGTSLTLVRRFYSPWGNRFSFVAPLSEQRPAWRTVVTPQAEAIRSQTTVREPIGEARNPLGFVELSAGPGFAAEALAATRRALLVAGGGAALLAGLLGLLISQRLASPLRSLADAAGRMASGDLTARTPLRSRDEIGVLASRFNHMAERLEASFWQLAAERDALRRFIADASHELRTPIAALKNFIALLRGSAAGDPQAQAEFLAESQVQVERLEWITGNLLDLSRLDAGLAELDLADHDLGEMLASAAAPFRTLAAEKSIALTIQPPDPPVQMRCDRARLEMALANLLDNALKFTPPGGQVEIGAEQEGETIRLWVRDTGAGIPPDEQPHIFERFYRGQHQPAAGSGLGLSIVKSVVEAQGGQVRAESTPGEGTRLILEWEAQDLR